MGRARTNLLNSKSMSNQDIIVEKTKQFVKATLISAEGGHDWFHIERVYKTAIHITKKEKANVFIVKMGALLHDIADPKFHNGDEEIGPELASDFLETLNVSKTDIEHIINIIKYVSFKNSFDQVEFNSKELEIIKDADRLDAIGAIGIARCFNYGGYKNRPLYNPEIPAIKHTNKSTYKNTNSPSFNHFYEKLLLLKDLMHTQTAKDLAEERHAFMVNYMTQFQKEWHLEF